MIRVCRALAALLLAWSLLGPAPVARAQEAASLAELWQHVEAKVRAGAWQEARPLLEKLAPQNPVEARLWLALAQARYHTKEYRQAIVAYEKAIDLRAGYPAESAYGVARCHARLGDDATALEWLQKALKMGLRDLGKVRADADLKALHADRTFQELVALVDTTKMSRDEGWRYDLKLLAREIMRLHFNPYRLHKRAEFDSYVRQLDEEIPRLKDEHIMARFMKLARMAGDGHTFVRPGGAPLSLPVQLFQFEEGVFVTAAHPEYASLAGAQVLRIGKHATADVLRALEDIISRDNPMGLKAMGPALMTYPRALYGLDLIPDPDKATLTVRDGDGTERTVTLSAGDAKADAKWLTPRKDAKLPEPLYLKNRQGAYWFEQLPEHKLVYCQYNGVRNDPKEPFEKFCQRLFEFIEKNDVDKLAIDLRWNGGGNSILNKPLIHGLIRSDKINQRGKLFVIIGRHTFSAAQNCATDIEMHTKALFVGEPTGSSPNFIGETVRLTLPYSKMTGSISDLYWGRSWPMDYRTWIAPQLYAPPSFALYKANRDPALEAVLK
ncbi:MAG: hypothetical protein L0215_10680 [Gemmataceae bacterium]|nr:hypothetical protein [Gemmataceae bacterium]